MKTKEQSDKEYLALVEKYERTLDENGNEPDYDFSDDSEVIGYQCIQCGNIQETPGLNMDCDKCCGCCLTEIYE